MRIVPTRFLSVFVNELGIEFLIGGLISYVFFILFADETSPHDRQSFHFQTAHAS